MRRDVFIARAALVFLLAFSSAARAEYHGDIAIESTFDVHFTTASNGLPTTLADTPVVSAYPANSTTQITAGITLSVDFDALTGLNNVRIAATAANGYASGTSYALVITTGTVNGVSVVGTVVGSFSIQHRSALRPSTAGRTLSVESDGMAHADVKEWLGSAPSALIAGRVDANTQALANDVITGAAIAANAVGSTELADGAITSTKIATDAIDADALASDAVAEINATVDQALVDVRLDELLAADSDIDGAAPPTVGSVFHELASKTAGSFTFDQTTDSLEALRDNQGTPQTGDTFARLGAPVGASVSADIAAIEAQTDDIGVAGAGLTSVPWNASWDAEVESEAADAIAAVNLDHLVGTATAIPALPAGTYLDQVLDDGTATYDRTTDSLQAVRDRGDAAWITGATSAELVSEINSVQTDVASVQGDTNDIQTRLPAALVGGRMDSDVEAIDGVAESAEKLGFMTRVAVRCAAVAGTLSTTQMTTDCASTRNDQYIGQIINWANGTACEGESTPVTDYVHATKTLTFTAVTCTPGIGDQFVMR